MVSLQVAVQWRQLIYSKRFIDRPQSVHCRVVNFPYDMLYKSWHKLVSLIRYAGQESGNLCDTNTSGANLDTYSSKSVRCHSIDLNPLTYRDVRQGWHTGMMPRTIDRTGMGVDWFHFWDIVVIMDFLVELREENYFSWLSSRGRMIRMSGIHLFSQFALLHNKYECQKIIVGCGQFTCCRSTHITN